MNEENNNESNNVSFPEFANRLDTGEEKKGKGKIILIVVLIILIVLGVLAYLNKDKIMNYFNPAKPSQAEPEINNVDPSIEDDNNTIDDNENTNTNEEDDNGSVSNEDEGNVTEDLDDDDYDEDAGHVYDNNNKIVGNTKRNGNYEVFTKGNITYGDSEDKYDSYTYINNDYIGANRITCEINSEGDEDCEAISYDVLGLKEQKLVKRIKTNEYLDAIEQKGYMIFSYYGPDSGCNEIYNKDFNLIAKCEKEVSSNYSVSEDGRLFVLNGKKVVEYNSEGNIINTSKEYNSIQMLVDNYIVIIKDKKLVIVTPEEKEVTITSWDNKKQALHTLLSGWFDQDNKHGIFLVVEDERITAKEIFNDCSKTECDFKTQKEIEDELKWHTGGGYEYYYVPETGEVGKYAIVIGAYAKPVLYLYPTKKTNVTVTFEKPENLTTTYPKYKDNWKVTAYPNGDLYDKDNKYYYALYWEEVKNHDITFNEGFYVNEDNAITFLEEKLTILGFNPRERNEFIMYWLPILENNKHNLIYFEQTKERDKYSKLNISPRPDSILRISMHVKKVNGKVSIKEQKLNKFNRTGFSAVEWGGVIH